MKMKAYNGISAVLKIICFLVLGLFYGFIVILNIGAFITSMDMRYLSYIFRFLIGALAVSGLIGMFARSISQVISIFKPDKKSKVVTFWIDIVTLVSFLAGIPVFWEIFSAIGIQFGPQTVALSMTIYVIAMVLTIIDAIVLYLGIKKDNEKLTDENVILKFIQKCSCVIIPVLIFCVFATITVMAGDNINHAQVSADLNGSFDSFIMTDFDGNEYTEEMFKGHKLTVINIWGTFCHKCVEEMPELEDIAETYDEKDLQLVGMTSDLYVAGEIDQDQVNLALDIAKNTGVTYPLLIPSRELMAGVVANVHMYPTTVFLDENGNQLKVVVGARTEEEWIDEIEEVLAGEE